MDAFSSMNEAMTYVEDHLTDAIDYAELARIARCSDYHFKRMFSFLAGIGLAEYIRRRRMTLAASDLIDRKLRIIDVALKYGYTSPDAFARAFQEIHGVLPSRVKDEGSRLKTYPKMTFRLTIQGGQVMNYRIVEKDAFHIMGVMKRVPIVFQGVNPEIAAMYEGLTPEIIGALKQQSNVEPQGMISASTNFSEGRMEEKGELDHYIGVATTTPDTDRFDTLFVEAGTWAVFESVGPFPETLQHIWGRIYSEWFPSSGYEAVEGPEILWNESPDTHEPDYRSEIWIPVRKK